MHCVPRRLGFAILSLGFLAAAATAGTREVRTLRVCADPNHLPYSNLDGEGFENRIAELLARELGWELTYTWWPQRRGFLRNTLNAGRCDVVVGVPARFDAVTTTRPYYASCYVWLYPAGRPQPPPSLDDPRLRAMRIGVHLIGDDYANSPPAHALAQRGVVERVVGYSVYGDYGEPSPLRAPVDALARGELDAAILWGPIAGFFGRERSLAVAPIEAAARRELGFGYEIALGVRRGDRSLQETLDRALVRRAVEIDAILERFALPRCDPSGPPLRLAATGDSPASANPYTGDAEAIAAGAKLFKKLNCYACHGAAGGGGMGPSLTDDRWQNGDGSDASLKAQIMEGRGAMPPYKDIVDEAEVWQLIAFLRTLYKGDPAKVNW